MERVLTDWDNRPAVLFRDPDPKLALALLEPGGDWVEVDLGDVSSTARVIPDEAAFRSRFPRMIGDAPLPTMPAKDGSSAASASS